MAIEGLIEEPTGLLSLDQRHLEGETSLPDHAGLAGVALDGLDIGRKALELARAAVVLENQRLAAEHLDHCVANMRLQELHARGTDLHHALESVAIHDQSRQCIGLAVNRPVIGLLVQPLAQRERDAQALDEPAACRECATSPGAGR